jgi:hypothetical protein
MTETKDIQNRFKVSFIDFVRPGSWPYPYSLEQAFQVLRWMTTTGSEYRAGTRWGDQGVFEVLSMKPSCRGFSGVDPITSLADLRQRFHYAILSKSENPIVDKWRRDHDILPDGKANIPYPVHRDWGVRAPFKNQDELSKALTELLEPPKGQKLQMAIALNSVHGKETAVYHDVQIKVGRHGFAFSLRFGDQARHEFGSRWDRIIASTRGNETFVETAVRAYKNYHGLVFGTLPQGGLDLQDMWGEYDTPTKRFVNTQLAQITEGNEATLEDAAPAYR